jgi:hypothetical protein
MDRPSRFPPSTPAQTNPQPQTSQSMGPIHPAHSHPLYQPFNLSQPVQLPPANNSLPSQRPAKRYREADTEDGPGGRDWAARDRIAEQYAAGLPTVGDGPGAAADPQIGPGSWHQLPPGQHSYTTSPDRSQSGPIPALPYSPAPPSDPFYSHYDGPHSLHAPSSSYSTSYPLAAAQGDVAPSFFDRALVCYRLLLKHILTLTQPSSPGLFLSATPLHRLDSYPCQHDPSSTSLPNPLHSDSSHPHSVGERPANVPASTSDSRPGPSATLYQVGNTFRASLCHAAVLYSRTRQVLEVTSFRV